MTDAHDQPEVHEAYWDRGQVEALFDDLQRGAIVRQVQVRRMSGSNRPEDSSVTLDQARELLEDGRTTAVQIYYEFDSQNWCDTLMVLPEAIRIVRTSVPSNR